MPLTSDDDNDLGSDGTCLRCDSVEASRGCSGSPLSPAGFQRADIDGYCATSDGNKLHVTECREYDSEGGMGMALPELDFKAELESLVQGAPLELQPDTKTEVVGVTLTRQ